jgi:hypothetical protein
MIHKKHKPIPFAKNYMENGGKVLAFTCAWNDPSAAIDSNIQKNNGARKLFSLQVLL